MLKAKGIILSGQSAPVAKDTAGKSQRKVTVIELARRRRNREAHNHLEKKKDTELQKAPGKSLTRTKQIIDPTSGASARLSTSSISK